MTELQIEFVDGSTDTLNIFSGQITENWREQTRAEVEVDRFVWQSIVDDVDKINDEFYVSVDGTREFGGRLVDYSNEEDSVILEIGSFEEDALTAKPTDPTEVLSGDDRDIVLDALSRIPNLSAGNVDTISQNIEFTFSNASPAKMIRDCQVTSGGFIKYNPDKTVDYEALPTGSSNVATVGPSESNVQDDFNVIENEREEFTNIRVLGAGEGDSQIEAEGSVSNVSGRESWGTYTDSSINSQSRANEILDNLIAEYEEDPQTLKVETLVFGENLEVGSKVQAVSNVDNIDEKMTVISASQLLEGNQDVYDVVLSNRLLSEVDIGRQQRQSIADFNSAYQGQVVTINSGGYRAPIDDGVPYEFSVRIPDDVIEELTAEIEIETLPYRSYGSFGEHSHEFSIENHTHDATIDVTPTSGDNSEFGTPQTNASSVSGVDVTGASNKVVDSFTVNSDSSFLFVSLQSRVTAGAEGDITFNLYNSSTGTQITPDVKRRAKGDEITVDEKADENGDGTAEVIETQTVTNNDLDYVGAQFVAANNFSGDTIEVRVTTSSPGPETLTLNTEHFVAGTHTHDVSISETVTTTQGGASSGTSDTEVAFDPGVNNYPNELPSNVAVKVNGNTVQSNIGDGDFNEVVSIEGELTQGFNLISVTSDTLGHVRATAFIDVYRQIVQ